MRTFVAILALCLSLQAVERLGAGVPGATTGAAGAHIGPPDIAYIGSFRVPTDAGYGAPSGFSFGGRAIAYDPAGDHGNGSIFVQGFDNTTHGLWVSEIGIPRLVQGNNLAGGSTNVSSLNTATVLQKFSELSGYLLRDDSVYAIQGFGAVGGLHIHNGTLYGTTFNNYDANGITRVSHWKHGRVLSDATFFGWESLTNPDMSGYYAGVMTDVPSDLQASLGGPVLTGQCCLSVITRTSLGPAAFAFDPERIGSGKASSSSDTASAKPVPVTALLYYPINHATLGRWLFENGDDPRAHPFYNWSTTMGGLLIERNSLLVVGRTGVGHAVNPNTGLDTVTMYYGAGVSDWSLNGKLDPNGTDHYAYDPTNNSKANHGWPYKYVMWGYDVADLQAVKAGRKRPWAPVPYAMWELVVPFDDHLNNGRTAVVSTYDSTHHRLYIAQQQADIGSAPLFHVYSVTP